MVVPGWMSRRMLMEIVSTFMGFSSTETMTLVSENNIKNVVANFCAYRCRLLIGRCYGRWHRIISTMVFTFLSQHYYNHHYIVPTTGSESPSSLSSWLAPQSSSFIIVINKSNMTIITIIYTFLYLCIHLNCWRLSFPMCDLNCYSFDKWHCFACMYPQDKACN